MFEFLCRGLLIAFLTSLWTVAYGQNSDWLDVVGFEVVDVEKCRSYHNGDMTVAPPDRVAAAFGEDVEAPHYAWHAGQAAGIRERVQMDADEFAYFIVLKQPVQLGTVMSQLATVRYLKPGVEIPTDPLASNDWLEATDVSTTYGVGLHVLPKDTKTQALLLSEKLRSGRSYCRTLRLLPGRYENVASRASVRALSEYHAPENRGARHYQADHLLSGRGPWISAGVNKEGHLVAPYISDVEPSWLVLAWPESTRIDGLFLADNFAEVKFQTFVGPDGMNPLIGVDDEWRRVKEGRVRMVDMVHRGRYVHFDPPLQTRGLRLFIERTWLNARKGDSQVAEIHSIVALSPTVGAANDLRPAAEQPPFAFKHGISEDGHISIVIEDADGNRVRNLVARRPVSAGEFTSHWDLKDDAGKYVPMGKYNWRSLFHPPLKLSYETTVYPNVSNHHPENSPWLNGVTGPGGWLADHSPPLSVCTAGDIACFGAPVPESGVGLAVCDLSGRKRWGIHSFAGFSGPESMATDGKTLFCEKIVTAYVPNPEQRIWAVDLETQEHRVFAAMQANEQREIGTTGLAVGNGKLYATVNAKSRWLINAVGDGAVDITKCLPYYKEKRKPKKPYEIVPDHRGDFRRLFRLRGTPPGGYARAYLDSTRGPEHRQHIVLAFTKHVNIGTCVFAKPEDPAMNMRFSVHKENAPYPPDPDDDSQWIDFAEHGSQMWEAVAAPEGTNTRALRLTFQTGEADELAEALHEITSEVESAWSTQLQGMKLLRRRYRNLFDSARVRVNSGTVNRHGEWDAQRSRALSESDPGIYVLEWDDVQKIRGLAIMEIDGAVTKIDVFRGEPGRAIDIASEDGWEEVASHTQSRRMHHGGFAGHNAEARYLDGYVDFGQEIETRAVRLRVISQWESHTREGSGVRLDREGTELNPARCRVYGVAPLQYLGGEVPVAPVRSQRLEVYDIVSGKLEKEIPLVDASQPAVNSNGELYALAGGRVVLVNCQSSAVTTVVDDLEVPTALAIDAANHFYVFDRGPDRKQVRVYDPQGAFLRTIGEPGGYRAGPWNPNRMESISGLAVDREGKMWAVDNNYWPKRVSCWNATDGAFLREYLGPTQYGGAGALDPQDRRRLYYGPMEFEIDWHTGHSRLKNLLTTAHLDGDWMNSVAGDMPIYTNDRQYMVTRIRAAQNTQQCGVVYLYEDNRIRPVAAVGSASAFAPLQAPAIRAELGTRVLTKLQFIWADRDGDSQVQFAELEFSPRRINRLGKFNRQLTIWSDRSRFAVREFLTNGTPVYEETESAFTIDSAWGSAPYELTDGSLYLLGGGEQWLRANGERYATYPSLDGGVGPDRTAPPYVPEQVVCQFGIVGHETAAKGDLGEFVVVNCNLGSWNVWTADGILAGRIFEDLRKPAQIRSWRMRAHDRRMSLEGVALSQEHFRGYVNRDQSTGKYYAVAGHNHASVVEIEGLDQFVRDSGVLEVKAGALADTRDWERRTVAEATKSAVKIQRCPYVKSPIKVDGIDDDWGAHSISRLDKYISYRMSYSDTHLNLFYSVNLSGPLKNSGKNLKRLFKTGAAVELHMGNDKSADPNREAPVSGDWRLLMTVAEGKPVVVLYEPVVESAHDDEEWEVVSPVTRVTFDRVRVLKSAKMQTSMIPTWQAKGTGYQVEVAIPLAELGLAPKPNLRLKFDWGVLQTDDEGNVVTKRRLWANRSTQVLADAPSEARLHPDMWGYVHFTGVENEFAGSATSGMLPGSDDDDDELRLEED